jgi:hypothetical protein
MKKAATTDQSIGETYVSSIQIPANFPLSHPVVSPIAPKSENVSSRESAIDTSRNETHQTNVKALIAKFSIKNTIDINNFIRIFYGRFQLHFLHILL